MSITYQEQEMSSLDDKRKSEFARVSHYAAGPMDREAAALARSGKKQVLKRNFGLLSMIGFSCSLMTTWEGVLASFLLGFQNGGPAGIIYGMIFTWAGTLSVFVTLGELASMMPTSSGQYHWVNLLAPKSTKKFLSYVTGWLTVAGWTAAIAAAMNYSSGLILAMAVENFPDYTPTGWHGTLVFWAVLLLCLAVNTVLSGLLPAIEVMVLVLHILGYFAILVPLVYINPQNNGNAIFTTWVNGGNWNTQALAFFIGLNGNAGSFIGTDGAVHMSEEVKSASVNVPRSMVWSVMINGILAFTLIIAFLLCADLDTATSSSSPYPFVAVLTEAVDSVGGGTAMVSIVTILLIFAGVGVVASASRMMWAFSRDRGMPGWRTLSKVHSRTTIPLTSVFTVSMAAALLGLINIGSTTAFGDVLSLILEALYASYLIVCVLLLYRRMKGQIGIGSPPEDDVAGMDYVSDSSLMQWGPWRVPEPWGTINNAFACVYLIIIAFFSFWPTTTTITAASMNYSVLVTGAVAVLSILYYLLHARKTYTGPVVEIDPLVATRGEI